MTKIKTNNKIENPSAPKEKGIKDNMGKWLYYTGIATFLKCPIDTDPANSDICLVGVPYSGGNPLEKKQMFAPRAMRHASTRYHKMNRTGINPYTISTIHDIGDVPFDEILDPKKAIKEIEFFYDKIYAENAIPVSIGGDHSITAGILRALHKSGPYKKPVALIHFDAHVDTVGSCWGIEEHCGGPFKIATDENIIDPKKTFQIGIRGPIGGTEDSFSLEKGMRIISPKDLDKMGIDALVKEIRKTVGDTPIYISLDVDALDPIYAPDTGTPELCGLSPSQIIDILHGLRGLEVVGADIVCVAPTNEFASITLINASGLLFEMTCLAAESVSIHGKRS